MELVPVQPGRRVVSPSQDILVHVLSLWKEPNSSPAQQEHAGRSAGSAENRWKLMSSDTPQAEGGPTPSHLTPFSFFLLVRLVFHPISVFTALMCDPSSNVCSVSVWLRQLAGICILRIAYSSNPIVCLKFLFSFFEPANF